MGRIPLFFKTAAYAAFQAILPGTGFLVLAGLNGNATNDTCPFLFSSLLALRLAQYKRIRFSFKSGYRFSPGQKTLLIGPRDCGKKAIGRKPVVHTVRSGLFDVV